MKVDVEDRLDAVGQAAWDGLVAASRLRSPFLGWAWQEAFAEAFAADRRLEIRRVTDANGELLALLPLYETEAGALALLGGADISDYLDLIVRAEREEQAWTALLESRTAAAVWEIHAVPAASPTVQALPRLGDSLGVPVAVTIEERCPVLALPDSWEAYLRDLSGKHRHELGRKQRRLERECPKVRATALEGPVEIGARLDEFLTLHRQSRAGKARFMDARMEGFFRRVASALAARGGLRLWFLETAGGPLASFLTLEWDDTVGLYNSGFDPERASLSPGVVLLAHLVRDAIERGRRRFDFLRGEERYKYEFEPRPEDVCLVRVG